MSNDPHDPAPFSAHRAQPLTGRFSTPGDKAISHRALILGALAVGRTMIEGLLEADDVKATISALRQLGVRIEQNGPVCQVWGLGVGGLLEPSVPLDFGNSGTGLRLMLGTLSTCAFATSFTGGPTLVRRPLQPLLTALQATGASVRAAGDGRLPITLLGAALPLPVHHVMATPSEQIKSALLLAGLGIAGTTTIVEPVPTDDHTEKLLADFGADITSVTDEAGVTTISLTGLPELQPRPVMVPGDPSSAGYAIVAALIVPGSELLVDNVLINPTRTGLIDTLLEMGGDIQFINQREHGGEHVADLRVRSSRLKGVHVAPDHAAAMLNDIPALAIAAAYATGQTHIEGLAELREQECDRLRALAAGLTASRVEVTEADASLTIVGDGRVAGGGTVKARDDHRIAMSFLVLGLASHDPVTVDDTHSIAASFPGFIEAMTDAGARIEPAEGH